MSDAELLEALDRMRQYYDSGATRSYVFRKRLLEKFRQILLQFEQEINAALYADLKKSPEEVWVTETGFLLSEIRHTLKHLNKWMRPARVKTNLLNFPSRSYVHKEPLGIVLIIAPWNYPLQLLLTPLVGALAAGNCCVIKPSEFAPATAAVIKKIVETAFAKELVLFVEGEGATVVPQLMNNHRFDHVFYTGSTVVGKKIYEMAARKLVPVTLELGGKSPCVVESDANIKVAARRIALTKFSNAGQMCVAPNHVLVHSSIKEAFISQLIYWIKQFYSEDPSSSYNYGKIINQPSFDRLINYLQQGKILYGGQYNADTCYIEPTLIENVPEHSSILSEEIFGPVLPIITFNTFEEAKNVIEKNGNPLALYIFSESKEKQNQWLSSVSFGGGCVNNASWHLTNPNLPFGGRGNSGMGAYHGKHSFDTFSHSKAVMKTPTWFDPAVKYPPFQGKLSLFKKIIK